MTARKAVQPQESIENQAYLSITSLNKALNATLESSLPHVQFEGEISQCTRAASGHLYLTLKDSESQVSVVMWRGAAQGLQFKPEQGICVLCHGKPNVYHKSGRLQIIVHRMIPAGEGLLQQKFLELKAKLEKEGLFSEDRKRPLPFFPRRIGLVTSKTGAALHDIMVKLRERMPGIEVVLADARVQGDGAADEIARGIQRLNDYKNIDVIIIGRGGGSLQDLWAFNEEVVVRAVFASAIPIISGVGHEVDVSLSDLAADRRAPTPTAAAEMAVPHCDELLQKIEDLEDRLLDLESWFEPLYQEVDELELRMRKRIRALFEERRLQLEAASAHIKSIEPGRYLEMMHQRITQLRKRIRLSEVQYLAARVDSIRALRQRLQSSFPPDRFQRLYDLVARLKSDLAKGADLQVQKSKERLETLHAHLGALSPQEVLKRGYALVEHGGKLIRSSGSVEIGEELSITLYEGQLGVEVKKISQ